MKTYSVYGRDLRDREKLRCAEIVSANHNEAVTDVRAANIDMKIMREPILVVIEGSEQ